MEALHANPDFNDASEEDEDDENADVALPVSLKKLMGVNKTRNKNQDLPGTGKHANDAGKDAKDAGKSAKSAGKEHQAVDKKMPRLLMRSTGRVLCWAQMTSLQ